MIREFKIEALKDSKGVYGLEFENSISGWFGDSLGSNYQLLIRPDVVASTEEVFLAPDLFQTVPFKDTPWNRRSIEASLYRLTFETICREKGFDLRKDGGAESITDTKPDICFFQKFWGLKKVAQKLINSRLNVLLSEGIPKERLTLIRRYPISLRGILFLSLCKEGDRAWQLAEVFPVLATNIYRFNDKHKENNSYLRSMVRDGASLKDIAKEANVPMSFRHFPPGTVGGIFAGAGRVLADRPDLIENYAPSTVPKMKTWLKAINNAKVNTKDDMNFAKWTARNCLKLGGTTEIPALIEDISSFVVAGESNTLIRKIDPKQYEMIQRLKELKGHFDYTKDIFKEDSLIQRPFNPYMAAHTVKKLSDDWHEAVAKIEADKVDFPEPWYSSGTVKDYTIEPIVDYIQLSAAAKSFRNCASTYSHAISSGECYLYTVSNGKKNLAMFELSRGEPPRITEVKGPCNRKVDPKISRAIHRWLREKSKAEGHGKQPASPIKSQAAGQRDLFF